MMPGWTSPDGGGGRYRRFAASASPGDSKATEGDPNVALRREATAPPRECPISQILDSG